MGTILGANFAFAGISINSGSAVIETNPTNFGYTGDRYDDPIGSDPIHAWFEQGNISLPSATTVDIASSGVYGASFVSANVQLPAGTLVNSYFFYYDPGPGNGPSVKASFHIDETILGVIVLDGNGYVGVSDRFVASDFLSAPGTPTIYQPVSHFDGRGLEMYGPNLVDTVRLDIAHGNISFELAAAVPGDQIRVITAVPEPTSLAFIIAGVGIMAFGRRRRKQSAAVG
ncbi:MAG: PEP-CTERM sorting domain-containing protein [Armatimonadota bacterium]